MSEEKKEKTTKDKKSDDVVIAAIGYIWVLCLVPLFLKRHDKFCQFHAKQGMVLFILSFAVMVLGVVPLIGWYIILPLGWMFIVLMSIVGIMNALQGKEKRLPIVGKYAEKIDL